MIKIHRNYVNKCVNKSLKNGKYEKRKKKRIGYHVKISHQNISYLLIDKRYRSNKFQNVCISKYTYLIVSFYF